MKKLSLSEIKVKSFTTNISDDKSYTLKGASGAGFCENYTYEEWYSQCGICDGSKHCETKQAYNNDCKLPVLID